MTVALQTEPLCAVVGVSFGYPLPDGGRRQVLGGMDLKLARGELVALVGTNGSGKTTLLRLLSGVLTPDAGEVRFDGRPIGDWRKVELARRVTVLPQQLELPVGFRVAELVEMGRAPHARRLFGSTADDEQAVARALADADALDLAHRFADELSGGERQRVLVAMALAQEPELLLMDEPTLHLDLAHQVAVLSTIRRLRVQRGLTVLAVLHDLNLAAAFAPRVVVLDGGAVGADGPPGDVLTPALVERAFGVVVDEVLGTDGRRHLALHL
ncbi:MAG TPA: ABC transporter ATP-binding protein [Candidatus Dormibacteraeota bacterium]|nr:ABC transporter ATP-binding protein [Candidatus Dormibacteraeota bacterium]